MLQEVSSDSVRIFSINQDDLLAELKVIAARICAEQPEVISVHVFGSIARGDHIGLSDVDVIIILRGDRKIDPVQQVRQFYKFFNLPIGVDLLVFTEDEISHRLEHGDPFISQAWQENIKVYPSDDIESNGV